MRDGSVNRLGAAALALGLLSVSSAGAQSGLALDRADGSIRIASFNANLNRKGAGVLVQDISKREDQVLNVAEILLRVRPDIVLINEIDQDPEGLAVDGFVKILSDGVAGLPGLTYTARAEGPMNTGVPSGFDLTGDDKTMGAGDAIGFGRFPGQYGFTVLSTFPIEAVRRYHHVKWSDAPWAKEPVNPDGTPWYPSGAWDALPLSSKSHWDVEITLPDGRSLHMLASHPTPPVFDGPEDRNGLRNAGEIRFWRDYIAGNGWMADENGVPGGLPHGTSFVIAGDLNADPNKGEGDQNTIGALVRHPLVQDPMPQSPGAAAAGTHKTARYDTADWPEKNGPGNLRVDYVLPSRDLTVTGSGVFWPSKDDPLGYLTAIRGRNRATSDHHLVWVDIAAE